MDSFGQINRRAPLLWGLLLSLTLLCTQAVKLHSHQPDHAHNTDQGNHHETDKAIGHSHLSQIHFAHDTSHDHHDVPVTEIGISNDGLLKNTFNHIFSIIFFAFFFALLLFIPSRQFVHRCRETSLVLYSDYLLSPPLRAPPR